MDGCRNRKGRFAKCGRAARRPAIGYGVFDFFGAWHVTVWSPDLAPGGAAYLDRRGAVRYGDFDVADRKFPSLGAAEAAGKAWVAQKRKSLKGTPAGRGYGRGGVKVVGQLKEWTLLRDEAGRFHLVDPEGGRQGVEAGTGRVDSPGEVPTHVKIWLVRGMTGKVPRRGTMGT